ncbi:ATP synthase subunit B family protein [Marilutibacter maris]|uniref:hypothetical protein n=1 Tax=Marilutibacter maris TaxID=1605891 RepID=UPI0011AE5E57|nr:hypothetical protein [Lysobacter maris]
MSDWQERIINHPVMTKLGALQALLDSVLETEESGSSGLDSIERLRQVESYMRASVFSIDPILVPVQILAKIDAPLQGVINEVKNYKSNKNSGHLTNANAHADALLIQVFQLPAPAPETQVENVRDAVVSFRRSAGQLLSSLERSCAELSDNFRSLGEKVKETSEEVSSQKARLDTAISEYQQQFSQAENSRREDFARAQAMAAKEVKEALESHRLELKAALDDSEADIAAFVDEGESKFERLQLDLQGRADALISEMRVFRDDAQELLQVIGSAGMAGEFQKAAQSVRRNVLFWQGVSLFSMLGLILFAILAYRSAAQEEIVWGLVGARAFVAASFAVLAVFAVRQNDRYHESEQRNRRYQLELSSIDPYLTSLPEDVRSDVKVKLADRLFGNAGAASVKGRGGAEGTSLDVAVLALETVRDFLKKGP